ncbi:zinc finger MYM-type protein 5-like [Diprion similis]|uniref:zinc finger MYM-type protein 5-like n=1 Tax=Diprion similis TaxID=362088 RepID=UPI001EF9ACF2|nr:zinc finger MYM-type protein 5-like [Diprion similis]
MSDVSKKLSGFQKRKRNEEKLQKEKELQNVPKLDSFFASSKPSTSASASSDWSDDHQTTNLEAVIGEDSGEHSESYADTRITAPSIPSVSDDPAEWILNDTTLEYLVQDGVKQNMDADLSSSKHRYTDITRYLSVSLFSQILPNGEKQPRPWLVFSKSKGTVFCAPCKMFGKSGSLANDKGYNDWKNAGQRMKEPENSDDHRSACATLLARKDTAGRVDKSLVLQTEEEIKYWHEVLYKNSVVIILKLNILICVES